VGVTNSENVEALRRSTRKWLEPNWKRDFVNMESKDGKRGTSEMWVPFSEYLNMFFLFFCFSYTSHLQVSGPFACEKRLWMLLPWDCFCCFDVLLDNLNASLQLFAYKIQKTLLQLFVKLCNCFILLLKFLSQ